MIDCLKCYRLRRHNDTVYCPFLDLKECVRGEHYINIASLPFKPKQEEVPPLPPKMVKAIPPFKPHPNSPHDWEKLHTQIFEMKITASAHIRLLPHWDFHKRQYLTI